MTLEPRRASRVEADMKTISIAALLAAVIVLPAGASATPDDTEKRDATAQCKTERGKSKATREGFRARYHGFSRCVRRIAAEEEAENETAHRNAAKACKAERAEDPDAFAEEYGTNKNRKNAFGKCVSSKAKAKKAEMDAKDERRVAALKNAAKECAREREEMGEDDFAAEHGTNPNKRNAFGRCVSDKAREGEGAPDA
jgi:hypothetical protein